MDKWAAHVNKEQIGQTSQDHEMPHTRWFAPSVDETIEGRKYPKQQEESWNKKTSSKFISEQDGRGPMAEEVDEAKCFLARSPSWEASSLLDQVREPQKIEDGWSSFELKSFGEDDTPVKEEWGTYYHCLPLN